MFSSIFATLFTAIKWVCGWWGQMLFGTYNGVKLTVPFSGFGNYGLTAKKSSLFSSFKEDDWRNDNAVDSGGDQCVTKPKIWTKSNPKLFSDTNFFRYRIRYFFRYQFFSETDTDTFFETKFFSKPIPIPSKNMEKFRNRISSFLDQNLWTG